MTKFYVEGQRLGLPPGTVAVYLASEVDAEIAGLQGELTARDAEIERLRGELRAVDALGFAGAVCVQQRLSRAMKVVEATRALWKWYSEGESEKRADAIHAMADALCEFERGEEK